MSQTFQPMAPPIRSKMADNRGMAEKPWVMFFQQVSEIIAFATTVQDKPVVTVAGADAVTIDAANVTSQVILDRPVTQITQPSFAGQFGRLPVGLRFRIKFLHSVDDSTIVWSSDWVGVEDQLSGVTGEYSSWEFEIRGDRRPELVSVPLIGAYNQ